MGYNAKNYTEQGGEKTVIGGELNITEEGKLTFGETEVSPSAYQSDSEATTIAGLVKDFNRLLGKLKAVGIMISQAPVISILIQPMNVTVTEGSMTESLGLEATVSNESELSYQWYSNTTESITGGTSISTATEAVFTLPTDLTVGTYYYYCVVSADDAESVTSQVVTVTVNAA